jgi:hypothetical protein
LRESRHPCDRFSCESPGIIAIAFAISEIIAIACASRGIRAIALASRREPSLLLSATLAIFAIACANRGGGQGWNSHGSDGKKVTALGYDHSDLRSK